MKYQYSLIKFTVLLIGLTISTSMSYAQNLRVNDPVTKMFSLPNPNASGVVSDVAALGDVDRDDFDDWASLDQYVANGLLFQKAVIRSGRNGRPLYQLTNIGYSSAPTVWVKTTITALNDVNGDGADDFVLGIPGDDTFGTDAGAVKIISGLDGTTLWQRYGASNGAMLGRNTVNLGDRTGDGIEDFGYIENRSVSGALRGLVQMHSGANQTLIGQIIVPAVPSAGCSLENVGDIDSDGTDDIAMGDSNALLNGFRGKLTLYSGATSAVIREIGATQLYEGFGCSVAGAGDVDSDGHADIVVGAGNGIISGYARVYSGADGTTIYHITPGSVFATGYHFGHVVDGGTDFDQDGISDFVVGTRPSSTGSGSGYIFSGATGMPIRTINHATASLVAGTDFNRDGTPDLIVANANEIVMASIARITPMGRAFASDAFAIEAKYDWFLMGLQQVKVIKVHVAGAAPHSTGTLFISPQLPSLPTIFGKLDVFVDLGSASTVPFTTDAYGNANIALSSGISQGFYGIQVLMNGNQVSNGLYVNTF